MNAPVERLQPIQHRAAALMPTTLDSEKRTVQVVWTTGARVRRMDWYTGQAYDEELIVDEASVDLSRFNGGAGVVLNSHQSYNLESVLGNITRAWIENGQGMAELVLSSRPDVAGIIEDIKSGVIRNISVGYGVTTYEVTPADKRTDGGTVPLYRAARWQPAELSFVPIPADPMSATRSADPGALCQFVNRAAAQPKGSPSMNEPTAPAAPVQTEAQRAAELQTAQTAMLARAAEITTLCVKHGHADKAASYISEGKTTDQVRALILEAIVAKEQPGGEINTRVQTVTDEHQTRMDGVQEALLHRMSPKEKLTDNGRQYRGMSLVELGRDYLDSKGVKTRGMVPMEVAGLMLRTGMHGTSDFTSLLANVANKRLRNAYGENPASYMRWARRAPNAPNFKNISVVNMSSAPDLLAINEHGEFKYGSASDGAETYAVATYGRIVSLTRQAIINDDLRGFDRLISRFGDSAMRVENRTVYGQLTANANLSDGVALFHATHANLGTGAPSALGVTALTAGRTAMRVQKGLQSEELNIAPAYLIVPAALEQTAYQLTSSNYVPAVTPNINEFRAGGRTAVEPIVEALLDANSTTAWYFAANNSQVDTVEYCYLDGFEGPVIDSEIGFETDGVSYRCRLDFAAKAVDHRGLYKANGA